MAVNTLGRSRGRDVEDRLAGWRFFPVVSLSLSRRF